MKQKLLFIPLILLLFNNQIFAQDEQTYWSTYKAPVGWHIKYIENTNKHTLNDNCNTDGFLLVTGDFLDKIYVYDVFDTAAVSIAKSDIDSICCSIPKNDYFILPAGFIEKNKYYKLIFILSEEVTFPCFCEEFGYNIEGLGSMMLELFGL